jgi:hypothetical protein
VSAKPNGKCYKKITLAAAQDQCAAAGARLCSSSEIKAGVGKTLAKSQCKVHGKPVWTSDSCQTSKGEVGTFTSRGDGRNANKDKCITSRSKRAKRSLLCCESAAPGVAAIVESGSAGSFAANDASAGTGDQPASGAAGAVSGTLGAICVFALVGIAVTRRRNAAAESRRAPRPSLVSVGATEEGAPRRESSMSPMMPPMEEPAALESENGFILDNTGNLRIASVKRGNPMYRNSVYITEEDEVGCPSIV